MPYSRPRGLLAGFHADRPEAAVPELVHIGEQWAPRNFFIPRHEHPIWEFYLQISGESRWDGPDAAYACAPGNFFAAPPNVPHQMHDRPPSKHHFFFAAIDVTSVLARFPDLERLWQRDAIVFAAQGESLLAPFRQLIREVSLNLSHRAVGIRVALECLCVEASRLLETAAQEQVSFLSLHPAVLRAKELLDHQPGCAWPLADLARRAGVSPSYLVERFTKEIGVSPRQYLLQVRIKQAQEMLSQSDIPVTTLALELGFSSSQHFAATFKRLTGRTARQYRKDDFRL